MEYKGRGNEFGIGKIWTKKFLYIKFKTIFFIVLIIGSLPSYVLGSSVLGLSDGFDLIAFPLLVNLFSHGTFSLESATNNYDNFIQNHYSFLRFGRKQNFFF